MRVVVVGGGIGGLAAAAFLCPAGADVVVLEQAGALGEVGAGIQLSPNATRLLARLGLGDALDRVAVRPVAVEQRRWADGTVLGRTPLGGAVEATFGAPYLHVHRADLVAALASCLPPHVVRADARVVAADPDGTVVLADGERLDADVVVGADGIHSTVRAAAGAGGAARFSGHVAYRALLPGPAVRALGWVPPQVTAWLGPPPISCTTRSGWGRCTTSSPSSRTRGGPRSRGRHAAIPARCAPRSQRGRRRRGRCSGWSR